MQEKIEKLALVLEELFSEYDLSPKEVLAALERRDVEHIPLVSFSSKKLSSLEIIVKYLKENRGKKYSEIARLIKRDDRTIWCTYKSSQRKQPAALPFGGQIFIPVSIFAKRDKSTLENLIGFLKDNLGFSFKKIAQILNKNYQTIYTTYRRGISK